MYSTTIIPTIEPITGISPNPPPNKFIKPKAPIDCNIETRLPDAIVPPYNDMIQAPIDPKTTPMAVNPNKVNPINIIKGAII